MHYQEPPPHIAQGLLELRRRVALAKIPESKLDQSLNVATWNIREFGKKPRLDASIYYIAEILSNFDLIAITELRDNLGDLKRVMDLLGPYWKVVFSDYISDPGGNHERIAYLYDKRMITLTGLVAEADAPRQKTKAGEYLATAGWWRQPYMASFRAGSFDFVMFTVHVRWGDSETKREGELGRLADWIEKRRNETFAVDRDFVVVGDFNIPSRNSPLYDAITRHGLRPPDALLTIPGSNLSKSAAYDQILWQPTHQPRFTNNGGVVDYFQEDWESLYPKKSERPASKTAFTYEMSDHLPLWIQIDTDIEDERLQLLSRKGD